MQLYAKDYDGQYCLARLAKKQLDYLCLECGHKVRVRSGLHRQPHFYHISPNIFCQQHRKSMQHLQVQWRLFKLLPANDCFLEKPFPKINRIADVVWESRKLVFEIQCSPISLEEVQNRIGDYRSQGYFVIWILHNRTFNQRKLSAAEAFLQNGLTYYTDIDSDGKGEIFDQYDSVEMGMRVHKLSMLPIQIQSPMPVTMIFSNDVLPRRLQMRLLAAKFHFQGDLFDCFLKRHDSEEMAKYYEKMKELDAPKETEVMPTSIKNQIKAFIQHLIVRPYVVVLHHLLEKASK